MLSSACSIDQSAITSSVMAPASSSTDLPGPEVDKVLGVLVFNLAQGVFTFTRFLAEWLHRTGYPLKHLSWSMSRNGLQDAVSDWTSQLMPGPLSV